MSAANKWNTQPAIFQVLQKLHELSLRAARLDILDHLSRTQAVLNAVAPSTPAEKKDPSNG